MTWPYAGVAPNVKKSKEDFMAVNWRTFGWQALSANLEWKMLWIGWIALLVVVEFSRKSLTRQLSTGVSKQWSLQPHSSTTCSILTDPKTNSHLPRPTQICQFHHPSVFFSTKMGYVWPIFEWKINARSINVYIPIFQRIPFLGSKSFLSTIMYEASL